MDKYRESKEVKNDVRNNNPTLSQVRVIEITIDVDPRERIFIPQSQFLEWENWTEVLDPEEAQEVEAVRQSMNAVTNFFHTTQETTMRDRIDISTQQDRQAQLAREEDRTRFGRSSGMVEPSTPWPRGEE